MAVVRANTSTEELTDLSERLPQISRASHTLPGSNPQIERGLLTASRRS